MVIYNDYITMAKYYVTIKNYYRGHVSNLAT